jgi:hypothetical protein
MSNKSPESEAADQRRGVLSRALEIDDPDADEAVRELRRADRRLSQFVVNARPHLARRLEHGRRSPPNERGPRTAAQAVLWYARAQYELYGELIDVYVDDQWLITVPVAVVRGERTS